MLAQDGPLSENMNGAESFKKKMMKRKQKK